MRAVPTQGDALYAAQRQRTRILERTERGVDVNGAAFAPYSENGPYYYYPNPGRRSVGPIGKGQYEKKQKAAVRRLLKITTDVSTTRAEYLGGTSVGGVPTKSGLGIRFESYADFKRSLGRAGVDLLGPRAPHMLQAIIVATDAGTGGNLTDEDVGLGSRTSPAKLIRIGIYGTEADRASGHNQGTSRLPKRYFFGASDQDIQDIGADIQERVVRRVKAELSK